MRREPLLPVGEHAARGWWDTYVAVLAMLAITFFFGMAAPDEPWAVAADHHGLAGIDLTGGLGRRGAGDAHPTLVDERAGLGPAVGQTSPDQFGVEAAAHGISLPTGPRRPALPGRPPPTWGWE